MIFSLLFISEVIFCSAQSWHWINPTTGLQQINDISFISPDQGMAVGDNGAILSYLNGEWSLAESPVNTTLNAVEFVNPDLAWAVGNAGVILHYDGNHWMEVSSPITGQLKDICYVDETHCWAVGSAILFYDGTIWQVQAEISGLETVGFLSADEGWAASSSMNFHHFSNGSWSVDPTFADGDLLFFHTIEPNGEGRLLMNGENVEQEGLLYENTGQGWQPIASGAVNAGISFYDASYGFGIEHARPMNNDLLPTIKHFNIDTWSTAYIFDKPDQLFSSIEAIGGDEAVAGDVLGYLHHGMDGNWDLDNGFMCDSILDMQFVKPNKGYLAGHSSGLWKYDAGLWSNIFNIPGYNINVIDFPYENSGYFGAFRSNDLLPFWPETKLFSYNSGIISEIMFPDESSFISSLNSIGEELIFTQRNTIFTYTNGQFTSEALAFPDSISDLKFMMPIPVNSNNRNGEWEAAWMSVKRHNDADSGVIFYKYLTNTWQEVYTTSSGSFNDLCIFGHYQVVAVGTNGLIAVFDGTNWTEVTPLTTEELLSVHLDEFMYGWAVGRNGTILQCIGGTWSVYENDVICDLNVVSFYDNTLGFIGGNLGAMLCTSEKLPVANTYFPVSDTKNSLKIFPNPAGESFTVEFESLSANGKLSITDLTGRVVMEKLVGTSGNGNQIMTISSANLSKGVYVLTLITGNEVRTGKVLVK